MLVYFMSFPFTFEDPAEKHLRVMRFSLLKMFIIMLFAGNRLCSLASHLFNGHLPKLWKH